MKKIIPKIKKPSTVQNWKPGTIEGIVQLQNLQ